MSLPAIEVSDLGKLYHLRARRRPANLQERLSGLFSRRRSQESDERAVWALKDVSFSVSPGDIVGIVGRNGAGKSTLLKLLSRITAPTIGRALLRGRVGSLLEVGSGFHHELSGRDNIYINGLIIGMTRAQVRRQFDAIVAFADIEQFLDQPVKHYSSGMQMRLAYSVAAHLDSEILLMDEVLAVGDAIFADKCLRHLGTVASQGRTILLVSHNLRTVENRCSRAIWIDRGRLVADGRPGEVIASYIDKARGEDLATTIAATISALPEDPVFRLHQVRVEQDGRETTSVATGQPLEVAIGYEVRLAISGLRVSIDVCDLNDTIIFRSHFDSDVKQILQLEPGRYQSTATIPADLLAGRSYTLVIRAEVYNSRQCIPEPGIRIALEGRPTGRINPLFAGDPVAGMLAPFIPWRTIRVQPQPQSPAHG